MGGSHGAYGCLYLGHGPIGGLSDVRRCASQAAQRILAITRMLLNSSDYLGMGGLHQQGTNSADKRRRVTNNTPRDRLGAEQARVSEVLKGVLKRLRAVREQRRCGSHDLVANRVDHL